MAQCPAAGTAAHPQTLHAAWGLQCLPCPQQGPAALLKYEMTRDTSVPGAVVRRHQAGAAGIAHGQAGPGAVVFAVQHVDPEDATEDHPGVSLPVRYKLHRCRARVGQAKVLEHPDHRLRLAACMPQPVRHRQGSAMLCPCIDGQRSSPSSVLVGLMHGASLCLMPALARLVHVSLAAVRDAEQSCRKVRHQ